MTLIVVDGPRGVGKTTMTTQLVEELKGSIDIELFKSQRPVDPITQMHQAINMFSENPKKVFVCDRFSLTEWVMSTALNRVEPRRLRRTISIIEERLFDLNTHYFVMMAPIDVLDERLREREAGRGWDVPKDVVWPLWTAAVGLSKVAEMVMNEDAFAQHVNLMELKHRALFGYQSSSWEQTTHLKPAISIAST